jgi:superfamily II DNA/RNA helicase
MDLLRLQKALLMCRLAANSTFLVDKQSPGFSSKLEYLDDLFARLFEEPERKALVFSEWTTMLDLIEAQLQRRKLSYVRLDGSVPQKKRQQLVAQFQNGSGCRLFLATNAGATGLNLQAANTVINVDLPWNPAVLEQRIGRAHRMGQKRPVHVFALVTEETIEENLLATLSAKSQLALAALDADSEVDALDLVSSMEELKRRLEVLLGAQAVAPIDESERRAREEETARLQQERVAEAGGKLLSATFDFLGQLMPDTPVTPESEQMTRLLKSQLSACIETGDSGVSRLTVALPDTSALDGFVETMARVIAANAQAVGGSSQPERVPS